MRASGLGAPEAASAGRPIDRRGFLRQALGAGLGVIGAPMLNLGRCRLAGSTVKISVRAIDLVLGSTVVDMLGLLTLDWQRLYHWYREPMAFTEPDFRKLAASGINIFHPAVATTHHDPRAGVLRWLRGWNALLRPPGCFLAKIASINDLLLVPKQGKLGVLIGFQNSTHFDAPADVELFYRLGQRVSQLTYNRRNRIGGGCLDQRDAGLTALGAAIVAEMNRVGMAVDLSHCGERTSMDAIAAATQPALVTHSNCRALTPNQPRCKSDELIRRLAAKGGVMGLTIVRGFVSGAPAPSLEDLLDHFDHVARLVGPEHVGLGSDADVDAIDPASGRIHPLYTLRGLEPRLRVFQIADGLLRRGYGAADVELMLGANFSRVLAEIFPDASWFPVPEWETLRDPFCPMPGPEPLGAVAAGLK